MYPDPHKQQLTQEDATAMTINTFAVGFLMAFVLWLALDFNEFEKITTLPAYLNEIVIGIENAFPGGLLTSFAMWMYQMFLKD